MALNKIKQTQIEQSQAAAKTFVKAARAAFTDSTAGNIVITSFTEGNDQLNEFNNSTGIFTATQARIYIISVVIVFNFSQTVSFLIVELQTDISGSWQTVPGGFAAPEINRLNTPQTANISTVQSLVAGQKLRLVIGKASTAVCSISVSDLSIIRQ